MNTVATPLGVEISSFDDEDSMLGPVDIDNGSPTDVGGDDAASYPDDESNVKTNHNDKSDVDQLDDDEYDKTNPKELDANHAVTAVGWFRQWWVIVWYKNCPLLQRRPIHLLILVFSGVAAVLVAWPAGRDYAADQAIFPPTLTDCGTVPPNFLSSLPNATDVSKVKLSMNDNWQSGLPVAVLSLGPMLTAIATYLIVHEEIQLHMLGVLRGLGMRDSVYWFSWYIPFAAIAVVNSLFAAITAKLVPVHVFGATYFGGIFGAFFFVQLALIGSSFFLAALSGVARRGAVWLILLMIVAVWVPINVLASQRSYNVSVATLANGSADLHTPIGLFWVNRQTMYPVVSINLGGTGTANTNNATCNIPIMSEQEGNYFKTTAERAQVLPTEFFLGCYASAGFGATAWAPIKKTDFGLAVFWFIPYFHFNTIWGNFAGFTGYPGIDFHASHARLTTGELAREVLPVPPSSANAQGTSLYPQGSMLQEQQSTKTECETKDSSGTGCIKYKSNCPAQNLQGYNFCAAVETHDCFYAPNSPAEGKSVLAMFGMLLALSLTYVLMASYWGIVFVGGAGTHRFYFFLLPSYWFGVRRRINNNDRSVDDDDEAGDYEAQQRRSSTSPDAGAVKVHAVSKFYGGVQALKPVTFEMARGEVTALLGHNGAGMLLCTIAGKDIFVNVALVPHSFLFFAICPSLSLLSRCHGISVLGKTSKSTVFVQK